MYNLKKQKGTFKGNIGECMFKLTRRKLILTMYFNVNKYLALFRHLFTENQMQFLIMNWHSIDGIEIENGKIILYEVKTKNQYRKTLGFKPKTALSTYEMYKESMKLGFVVKLATVFFKDDWHYDVLISDFGLESVHIDRPKRWDKKY